MEQFFPIRQTPEKIHKIILIFSNNPSFLGHKNMQGSLTGCKMNFTAVMYVAAAIVLFTLLLSIFT